MDLARPSGVVFDESFGLSLLTEKSQGRFSSDAVYVKGIAEDAAMTVYCLRDSVQIPAYNKSPLHRSARSILPSETLTFRELAERTGRFQHKLPAKPIRTDDIRLYLEYPAVRANGTKHASMVRSTTFPASYTFAQNKHIAVVDYAPIVSRLKERGVKGTWLVTLSPEYSVAEDDND